VNGAGAEGPQDRGAAPAACRLLLPAGAGWRETARWRLDEVPATGHVMWGELRIDRGLTPPAAARRVLRREAAIAALRFGAREGTRAVRVHRVATSGGTTGPVRARLAGRLRSGVLVELGADRTTEASFDQVLRATRLRPTGRLIVGAGGGIVQHASTPAGARVLLRVGVSGGPSDPLTAAAAYQRLEDVPEIPAPVLVDQGGGPSTVWTVESVLPGRPGSRLTTKVWWQVLHGWSRLPRASGPARATQADLDEIARYLPRHAAQLQELGHAIDATTGQWPGILAHRDLWPGNLLVDRGHLAGIIDWGSWRPDALPGSDLLQLYAAGRRQRRPEPLGVAWLRRPWLEQAFRSALAPYWAVLDLDPEDGYLAALGVAWWASEVAGTLQRIPARRRDQGWLSTNVDPVLTSLGGG
jgi:hypothetical protein